MRRQLLGIATLHCRIAGFEILARTQLTVHCIAIRFLNFAFVRETTGVIHSQIHPRNITDAVAVCSICCEESIGVERSTPMLYSQQTRIKGKESSQNCCFCTSYRSPSWMQMLKKNAVVALETKNVLACQKSVYLLT